MRKLTMYLVYLFAPVYLFAQPAGGSGSWEMIFEDNFNGTTLDQSKWSYNYPWGNGHTHNHSAWCVPEQVTVSGGYLRITATNQKHPESTSGYDYTSGIVTTSGKFSMSSGFLEGRFRMPATLGTWPAFWTLGAGWPPEIDVLEVPFARTQHHYYLHYTNSSGSEASFGGTHNGPDKSAGFHTYGVEWGSNYMYFYFDGARVASYNNRPECAQAINQYILINLAVGGWAGTPPAGAVFPCTYQCDWVRAWRPATPTASVANGVYRISPSHATNQALEMAGQGTVNGTNIQQWNYWGGNNQRWTLTNLGTGYYSVRPVNASGQSMDVDSWSTVDGANIMSWAYAGGTNQQFQFVVNGNGYNIKPRHSGKCVDISSASTANGANVLQWTCNGGANQRFILTKLSSAEDALSSVAKDFEVYPNPANGSTLTIKAMLNNKSDVNVSIYNLQGLQVYREEIGTHNAGELVYNVNVENLTNGMYVILLGTDEKIQKSVFVR